MPFPLNEFLVRFLRRSHRFQVPRGHVFLTAHETSAPSIPTLSRPEANATSKCQLGATVNA